MAGRHRQFVCFITKCTSFCFGFSAVKRMSALLLNMAADESVLLYFAAYNAFAHRVLVVNMKAPLEKRFKKLNIT
jgi:hypothetical protein